MAEARWKALADVVVAGKAVKANTTFTAPAAAVQAAVLRGWVQKDAAKQARGKQART